MSVSRITEGLRARGYAHLPEALDPRARPEAFLELVRTLGRPVVPPGGDASWPVVETAPSTAASDKRPFDQAARIGWHNDFTTHRQRPRWTVMWIVQGDPAGGEHGAWRVVSALDVVNDPRVRRASTWRRLQRLRFPFGYTFEQRVRYFKILRTSKGPGLRFNRRGLLEGAAVVHGTVPAFVRDVVDAVEEAADRSAVTIPGRAGDVLAVDNWRSMHDRLKLSVQDGPTARRAVLCFVDEDTDGIAHAADPRAARWD
jgi:hypothetical protein